MSDAFDKRLRAIEITQERIDSFLHRIEQRQSADLGRALARIETLEGLRFDRCPATSEAGQCAWLKGHAINRDNGWDTHSFGVIPALPPAIEPLPPAILNRGQRPGEERPGFVELCNGIVAGPPVGRPCIGLEGHPGPHYVKTAEPPAVCGARHTSGALCEQNQGHAGYHKATSPRPAGGILEWPILAARAEGRQHPMLPSVQKDRAVSGRVPPTEDPVVTKDPPRWTGAAFKGTRWSQTTSAYMRAMSGYLRWCSAKADERGEQGPTGEPRAPMLEASARLADHWAVDLLTREEAAARDGGSQ